MKTAFLAIPFVLLLGGRALAQELEAVAATVSPMAAVAGRAELALGAGARAVGVDEKSHSLIVSREIASTRTVELHRIALDAGSRQPQRIATFGSKFPLHYRSEGSKYDSDGYSLQIEPVDAGIFVFFTTFDPSSSRATQRVSVIQRDSWQEGPHDLSWTGARKWCPLFTSCAAGADSVYVATGLTNHLSKFTIQADLQLANSRIDLPGLSGDEFDALYLHTFRPMTFASGAQGLLVSFDLKWYFVGLETTVFGETSATVRLLLEQRSLTDGMIDQGICRLSGPLADGGQWIKDYTIDESFHATERTIAVPPPYFTSGSGPFVGTNRAFFFKRSETADRYLDLVEVTLAVGPKGGNATVGPVRNFGPLLTVPDGNSSLLGVWVGRSRSAAYLYREVGGRLVVIRTDSTRSTGFETLHAE